MKNFRDVGYTIIHGTNDDNVHFQNAAIMQKELVNRGIDFEAYVSRIITIKNNNYFTTIKI